MGERIIVLPHVIDADCSMRRFNDFQNGENTTHTRMLKMSGVCAQGAQSICEGVLPKNAGAQPICFKTPSVPHICWCQSSVEADTIQAHNLIVSIYLEISHFI